MFEVDEASVVRDIAPGDEMLISRSDAYFAIGRAALECIDKAMQSRPSTYRAGSPTRILDLPCGHGRVLRYLRAAFPGAEITACDVNREGVDFCARTFGAVPLYSERDPRSIDFGGEFDLIWCGSLLTHLDSPMWEAYLDLFESLLAHSGLVVFTTHGRRVADMLRRGRSDLGLGPDGVRTVLDDFDRSGFGYSDYPSQSEYGISLAAPSWVCGRIETRRRWRLLTYSEMAWSSFGDVVSCVRRPVERVRLDSDGHEIDPPLDLRL